jgi:hypothetical protein
MSTRTEQIERLIHDLTAATREGTATWSTTETANTLRLDNDHGTVLLHGPETAGAARHLLLLRFYDRDGNELVRYDGDAPGLAGPPPLRHRAALLTLYETAVEQVHDTEGVLNGFLNQL